MKKIVKIIAAILLFVCLFVWVQEVLSGKSDTRDARRIAGFYELPENSLDAVFVGSSATYAFWSAPYAWYRHGIAVYPYSTSNMPIEPMRYIIEEARKTQPDALYIVNITSLYDNRELSHLHYLFTEMPPSLTKLKAVHYTGRSLGYSFLERLELHLPIIRFHDRWHELESYDFNRTGTQYMSGNTYDLFFSTKQGLTGSIPNEGNLIDLPANLEQSLNDLLDYIEKEDVNVLFVIVPQSFSNQKKFDYQNSAVRLLTDRGYGVLNLHEHLDEIGIDYATDFYDAEHTNVHGALKVTEYISEYIVSHYTPAGRRDDAANEAWDTAFSKYYYEVLEEHLTEADRALFIKPLPQRP